MEPYHASEPHGPRCPLRSSMPGFGPADSDERGRLRLSCCPDLGPGGRWHRVEVSTHRGDVVNRPLLRSNLWLSGLLFRPPAASLFLPDA